MCLYLYIRCFKYRKMTHFPFITNIYYIIVCCVCVLYDWDLKHKHLCIVEVDKNDDDFLMRHHFESESNKTTNKCANKKCGMKSLHSHCTTHNSLVIMYENDCKRKEKKKKR